MSEPQSERRGSSRHSPGGHEPVRARIRPGYIAALIDVSTGGALIETSRRLLPGAVVEIYMETESRRASVRGRVLRCAVVKVRPSAMHYRAAIQFDSYLPWFVEDDGYVVHEGGGAGQVAGAGAPSRVGVI